ncbi:hypothetical protein JCGZ_21065 [Jatropha curcas]|uniref:Remorin C-terminal domain-containing protein n=1 Tax=Jatropha curcas TaxID=180498 RepID=A0A067JQ66_JATCU|nr:hypothetical protein JCGZ_21065 [Jatropha curcas]
MLSAQRPTTSTSTSHGETDHDQEHEDIRDIHALTPPPPPSVPRGRWETGSHRSISMSSEGAASENFTSMSREFNALVLAGSAIGTSMNNNNSGSDHNEDSNLNNLLARIGEDEVPEETNPLAIVPDTPPLDPEPSSSSRRVGSNQVVVGAGGGGADVSVQRVKKEEIETKISAWQNAKIAKINNRFKREDAIINGWESEQVQKASSWMKKVERKLEEKRARALEKMQNEVAKAHKKAEDRRASAKAKRGTKVARVLETANLMRAVGRAPAKRSFFEPYSTIQYNLL